MGQNQKIFFTKNQLSLLADSTTTSTTSDKNVQPKSTKNLTKRPNSIVATDKPTKNSTSSAKRSHDEELLCPAENQAKFQLFPFQCKNNQDCSQLGKEFRCCKLFGSKRCVEGLPKPLMDLNHER